MNLQHPVAAALQKAVRSQAPAKNFTENWIKQRVQSRRGPMTPPFQLQYQHIFILPTRFGVGFGVLLIFMALGGLNFNNNMALLLVFLLGTITQLTTFIAYRNLAGLHIEAVYAEPVFCTAPAQFRLFVSNRSDHQRFALQAGFDRPQLCKDIALNENAVMPLSVPTITRGWLKIPSLRLETRFPLGLFKAWSWVFPTTRCLVYPAPASDPPPLPKTGQGQSGLASKGEGDQVHGLRKYQPGDSLQRVAWRASARHNELYSLEMETPSEQACALDWFSLPALSVEKRLSILTAWVIAADHRQLTYKLILPNAQLANGKGTAHRLQCLEMLALFEK